MTAVVQAGLVLLVFGIGSGGLSRRGLLCVIRFCVILFFVFFDCYIVNLFMIRLFVIRFFPILFFVFKSREIFQGRRENLNVVVFHHFFEVFSNFNSSISQVSSALSLWRSIDVQSGVAL